MFELLFWLYLLNATFLIVHEMDSTYWKEWELFRLPGGQPGFLLIHIPLVIVLIFGIIPIYHWLLAGIIYALVISLAGIFAFVIHTVLIRKGHPEFRTGVSQFILWSILLLSLAQGGLSAYMLIR